MGAKIEKRVRFASGLGADFVVFKNVLVRARVR